MGWGEEEEQGYNKTTEKGDKGPTNTALQYWAGL
jgi:hypothetical protein